MTLEILKEREEPEPLLYEVLKRLEIVTVLEETEQEAAELILATLVTEHVDERV